MNNVNAELPPLLALLKPGETANDIRVRQPNHSCVPGRAKNHERANWDKLVSLQGARVG
jgi:hypothetical protein